MNWHRIFLCLVISLTIGCNPDNQEPTPKPAQLHNWSLKFFERKICEPPCWENITPGITTIDEAIIILNRLLEVKIRKTTKNGQYFQEISWDFWSENLTAGQHAGGRITANLKDSIIQEIILSLEPNKGITFDQFIQYFGEPDFLNVWRCYDYCEFSALYEHQNMVVDGSLPKMKNRSINLKPNTGIDLIKLSSAEEIQKNPIFSPFKGQPWAGYTTYKELTLDEIKELTTTPGK